MNDEEKWEGGTVAELRDKMLIWGERNACIKIVESFVKTHNVPAEEKELVSEICRKMGEAIRVRYYNEATK